MSVKISAFSLNRFPVAESRMREGGKMNRSWITRGRIGNQKLTDLAHQSISRHGRIANKSRTPVAYK
jgi:hypothetical protein